MNQLVPLSVMGDGVTRLTSLVLAVATFRNGIIVVDEIENGLHYSILADIWKAIATAAHTFNTQIFATTHSREMILAAHQAFSERETYNFRLHRLDRSKKTGQIKAVTYDKETLEAAIDSDFEVR
jgi:AAA15 family ATPase/GTPase